MQWSQSLWKAPWAPISCRTPGRTRPPSAARGGVSPPRRQLLPLPAWMLRPPEEDEDGGESGCSWSKSPKHDTGEEFTSAGQAPLCLSRGSWS